ncbi:MAG: YiiX/YebB-like N1pC/P60 family cysteine hydrolase [Ferruginibacter sp.]
MHSNFFSLTSLGCCFILMIAFLHEDSVSNSGADAIESRINGYIQTGAALLKEGDIVVRMNQDPASEFIRYFNKKDKKFSHAGLAIKDKGALMIYHMASEDGNPMKLMLRQKLDVFAEPRHNYGYAIYRYKLTASELNSMRQLIKYWYKLPVHFDTAFNLASDNMLYCSEMVQKAISKSTHNRIKISATNLNDLEAKVLNTYYKLPSQPGSKLIAIDDLYVNAECENIGQFSYQ